MFEPFEIFKITDGQPLWIKSAPTHEDALTQAGQLVAVNQGEYLIFSHRTRERTRINTVRAESHV
jgi:hypothetical protein